MSVLCEGQSRSEAHSCAKKAGKTEMKNQLMQRTSTTPIPIKRSVRRHGVRNLTSLPAGKMVPVTTIPLFREDSVRRSRLTYTFEMHETVEMLMNAVHLDLKAYLVPNLAFDRFDGMDALNRAYEGKETFEGSGVVTPYIETKTFADPAGDYEFFKYSGTHFRLGEEINTAYLETYNQIWNFRARNRSADIELRGIDDTDLAPAFWKHTNFQHIVPDFDQAVIDGEVALNVSNATMDVRSAGSTGDQLTYYNEQVGDYTQFKSDSVRLQGYPTAGDEANKLFAELQADGITVSLSNIELAKKTAAFARMREQYTGHSDDYIIDLLMQGITVPEQAYKQPILVGQNTTVFGMSKRYATDGADLTKSVVNGGTVLDLTINVPRIPVGGVIMVVAEVTPEQLFERQKDYYLHATTVEDFPNYQRDELDPEKVAFVTNDHVDIDHTTPVDTFGYAPLNHQWDTNAPKIGGRFYRPEVDASFDEARQRIWAVETQDPTLAEDFYLCTNMHQKPFHDRVMDPFDVVAAGEAYIEGNTVFGGRLIEAQDNYEAVLAEAPQERIDKAA